MRVAPGDLHSCSARALPYTFSTDKAKRGRGARLQRRFRLKFLRRDPHSPSVMSGAANGADPEERTHAELLAELPLSASEGILEDMLCCVCQQPSLDNVSCCAQGHNACRECAEKLTNGRCPQSCGPLVKPNQVWMKNVPLNSLIRESQFKCGNTDHGCNHKCKIRDMKAHLLVCNYRLIDCPCSGGEPGCEWRGPACELEEHLSAVDHGKYAVQLALMHRDQLGEIKKRSAALNTRFDGMVECFKASRERERGRDNTLQSIVSTLATIKDHTDKKDGSSVRNQQRHRQLANQVEGLKTSLAATTEERDGLLNGQSSNTEELEALRDELAKVREMATEAICEKAISVNSEKMLAVKVDRLNRSYAECAKDLNIHVFRAGKELATLVTKHETECREWAKRKNELKDERNAALNVAKRVRADGEEALDNIKRKAERLAAYDDRLERANRKTHDVHVALTALSRRTLSQVPPACPCDNCHNVCARK